MLWHLPRPAKSVIFQGQIKCHLLCEVHLVFSEPSWDQSLLILCLQLSPFLDLPINPQFNWSCKWMSSFTTCLSLWTRSSWVPGFILLPSHSPPVSHTLPGCMYSLKRSFIQQKFTELLLCAIHCPGDITMTETGTEPAPKQSSPLKGKNHVTELIIQTIQMGGTDEEKSLLCLHG